MAELSVFSICENFNEFRFSVRAGHSACRNCYQIFSDDIRIMKRVFGRRSAIFRQMPSYTSGKQAALASDREKRTNALFICSRSAANRTASVGRSQSMIARVQFAICVCAYARCTLSHARRNFHRGACGYDGCAEGFTNSRGWAFATAIIGSTLMHAM